MTEPPPMRRLVAAADGRTLPYRATPLQRAGLRRGLLQVTQRRDGLYLSSTHRGRAMLLEAQGGISGQAKAEHA